MGDSISKDQGKGAAKGWFHQATGVPFATFVSGQGTAYTERKQNLFRDVVAMKAKEKQQLALYQNLQKQRDDIEQNIKDLQVVSGEAKTELAELERQRIEVEKRMHERHLYPFKPDIGNAPGAILWGVIGKIPVVGPVIGGIKTTVDIGVGVKNEINDRKALADISDKTETFSGFKQATDSYTAELEAAAKKLKDKETANLNAIKTLQHSIATTEKQASDM